MLRAVPREVRAAALVFIAAFALYAGTTGDLLGYEGESAAVAEGVARTGTPKILARSPIRSEGTRRRAEQIYGRVGLSQPLLQAPFYLLGWAADGALDSPDPYNFRKHAALFYNPFVAAVTATLVFAIILTLRRSLRWAVAMSLLFTAASIAWPYAKLGMETTSMMSLALLLLAALITRNSNRVLPWALTGMAAGFAIAAKNYNLVLVLPFAWLLVPSFRALTANRRLQAGAALLLPILAWVAAVAWYNWFRTGSILATGNENYFPTFAAPLNAIGLLVSPGKGLLLYSPLVALGLIGLVRLWRDDRRLAQTIVAVTAVALALGAGSAHWTDETWGPRYLVPVAWMLLLPIPWWADSLTRRRVLGVVAGIAVMVQVVGVTVPFTAYVVGVRTLTGAALYTQREDGLLNPTDVPFGRDSARWIPEISPLIFQTEVLAGTAVDAVGGPRLTVTYFPFEGVRGKAPLIGSELGVKVPHVWWWDSRRPKSIAFGLALLLLSAACVYRLIAVYVRRPQRAVAL